MAIAVHSFGCKWGAFLIALHRLLCNGALMFLLTETLPVFTNVFIFPVFALFPTIKTYPTIQRQNAIYVNVIFILSLQNLNVCVQRSGENLYKINTKQQKEAPRSTWC